MAHRLDAKQQLRSGLVRRAGEGPAWWFLGSRMTLKADTAQTGGTLSVLEQHCPPGFAPPPHVHHDEEEMFFVIEGRMTVTVGDETTEVSAGDYVFLPRDVWHGFVVSDEGVRIVHLTTPAQFERFVDEVGTRATDASFRPPAQGEIERLRQALPKYGLEAG